MSPMLVARPEVYLALLRGVNVGGKNIVSMTSLKSSFERLGFQDVGTYINSGNVLFRASGTDARALERRIDRTLLREHGLSARTVVRSHADMARLVRTMSRTWKRDRAWRYNVIFLRHEVDSKQILEDIDLKPGIERVKYCPGTLLWSARLDALTRTAMLKLSAQPVYKYMTVRNVNTAMRILALMQPMQRRRQSSPSSINRMSRARSSAARRTR